MEAVMLTVAATMAILGIYVISEAIIAFPRWALILCGCVLGAATTSALGADTPLRFEIAAFIVVVLPLIMSQRPRAGD